LLKPASNYEKGIERASLKGHVEQICLDGMEARLAPQLQRPFDAYMHGLLNDSVDIQSLARLLLDAIAAAYAA
jgi:hypothetical protein